MIEATLLPLGADVQDDASHPAVAGRFAQAERAMRDAIREATQQDWHLIHTGGSCSNLTLQGEGEAWVIVGDDCFAPMSPGELSTLWHLPRYVGPESDPDDGSVELATADFATLIRMCQRLAETGELLTDDQAFARDLDVRRGMR